MVPMSQLAHTADAPQKSNLIAGQEDKAGEVHVWNDEEFIYVKYISMGGWLITETHCSVVADPNDFPTTGSDNPKIGKFEFSSEHDPGVTEVIHKISWTDMNWPVGSPVFIACHAVVEIKEGEGWREETAWGCFDGDSNSYDFDGKRWGCYFDYKIQDEPGEPGKPGLLNIPEDPVTAIFDYYPGHLVDGQLFGEPSFFDVNIQGIDETVDPPYDVWNGWYDGWCADSTVLIVPDGVKEYNVKMYLSTDENLPAYADNDEQWDKINYMLNQYINGEYDFANWRDFQNAIWHFADDPSIVQFDEPGVEGYNPANKDLIVADANAYGEGFFPGPGQWMAIILVDPDDPVDDENGNSFQLTFIVVDP
jgi:hypothetical protein